MSNIRIVVNIEELLDTFNGLSAAGYKYALVSTVEENNRTVLLINPFSKDQEPMSTDIDNIEMN